MIKVNNLAAFDAQVERWFASVKAAAEEAAVGLAQYAFTEILDYSPQYSGDFVANWMVGTSVTGAYKADPMHSKGTVYKMGDEPAKAFAMGQAVWPKIKLGQSIFLYNNARHNEPYAWKIERGEINFRDVNQGADHPVRRAALTTGFNFTNIGPVQLDSLRKFGV